MNLKDRLLSGKSVSALEMMPATNGTMRKSNLPSPESILQMQSSIIQKQQEKIQTLSSEITNLRNRLQEKISMINTQDQRLLKMDGREQVLQMKLDSLTEEVDALRAQGKVEELKVIQTLPSNIACLKKDLLKKDETILFLTRQVEMMSAKELPRKEYTQLKKENNGLIQDAQNKKEEALTARLACEKEQTEIHARTEKATKIQRLGVVESHHIESLPDIKASHQRKYRTVRNMQMPAYRNQLKKQEQQHLTILISLLVLVLGYIVFILLLAYVSDRLRSLPLGPIIVYQVILAIYIWIQIVTTLLKSR